MKMPDVPELEHDAMMECRFAQRVSPNGKIERRVVAALVEHMGAHGFVPHAVYDGEEETAVHDAKSAMELIFNLDEASLRFHPAAAGRRGSWHGVLLVLGNGIDVISDWNYFVDDHDGFDKAMRAFDAEEFA